MLTRAQEKLILSTHTKKGREKSGLFLVEGPDLIREAGGALVFSFTAKDTERFTSLVTTEAPQFIAGLAKLPTWTIEDCAKKKTTVVLDHIQDPGNLGTILRSAYAFGTSLLLVECVDVGNPKVVRSSAGAIFHTPFLEISREEAASAIADLHRPVFRLELRPGAKDISTLPKKPLTIVAGSEGEGIRLPVEGPSVKISHEKNLESLNVSVAVSIALHARYEEFTPS